MAKKSKKKSGSGSTTGNASENAGNMTSSSNSTSTSPSTSLNSFEKFINLDNNNSNNNNNSINQQQQQQSNNSNNNNNANNKINKILGMQLSEYDVTLLEATIHKLRTCSQTKNYLRLQQELKSPPETVICSMRLANNEYYNEKYTQAIEYYNTAIHLASQHPPYIVSILLNRAITKLRIQEYKKSILDCTLALSIQPNCIKAYICRAYGYFFTKEFKKAFSDHYLAVHLIPPYISLRKAMRISHRSTLLTQTVNIDTLPPNLRFNHQYKGIQLDWLSDFNILAIEEEPCRMHLLYNYINNQIERSQKSKDKQSQIPSLIPAGESFYGNQWSEFEEYHSQIKSNISESLSSKQKLLGNSDYQSRDYISAVGHYTKAIKLNPEDPFYYSNRGISYLKLDRYLEAITDCSVSIEKQPSLKGMKAYLRRGAGYSAIGEFGAAEKDFRAALKYEPDSLEVLLGLEKTLKFREQEIGKSLVDNPGNNELLQTLKSLQSEIEQLSTKIAPSKDQHQNQQQPQQQQQKQQAQTSSTPQPSSQSSPQQPQQPQQPQANISNNGGNVTKTNADGDNLSNSGNKINVSSTTTSKSNVNSRLPFYKPFTNEQMTEKHELLDYFTNIINKRIGHLPTSYLGRAEVNLQLDLLKNALEDYEKGLELDPSNSDLLNRYKYAQELTRNNL